MSHAGLYVCNTMHRVYSWPRYRAHGAPRPYFACHAISECARLDAMQGYRRARSLDTARMRPRDPRNGMRRAHTVEPYVEFRPRLWSSDYVVAFPTNIGRRLWEDEVATGPPGPLDGRDVMAARLGSTGWLTCLEADMGYDGAQNQRIWQALVVHQLIAGISF